MSGTSSIKKRSRVDGGCTSSSKDGDDGLAVRDDELTEIKVSMNRLMDHNCVQTDNIIWMINSIV